METKYFIMGRDPDETIYKECAEIIRRGGLVAFPTETVYGLGVSAFRGEAVPKVFEAKGRPSDNPLIVHVAYPEDAEEIARTSELYYKLAERFMPGPLTVILPKKDTVPDAVTGGLDSVGVRCPSHPVAHKLIIESGVPIAAPSANLSGAPSPTLGIHVMRDMKGRADAVIDGGSCDFGLESTVIKLCGEDAVILRPGAVTEEDLLEICRKVTVSEAVKNPEAAGARPESPGMKYKHYSPNAEFILLDTDDKGLIDFINGQKEKNLGVIISEEEASLVTGACTFIYGKKGDIKEYCHRLFAIFREADDKGVVKLFAPLPDDKGQSLALYNRMIRAAGNKISKIRR
ncbi:MAG: threonylcarbamoyl-AMP synthase [Ruminococcaceae bacterium]|nr:threonylcarbamoyl-AMP synthase [Oscillospiraceae bacterium]